MEIYSGTVDTNSINNFYSGLIMIDNGGNTNKITNGQGRVFWDSDGVSEKIASLKSAHISVGSVAKDAK